FFSIPRRLPCSMLFPYTTLFRSKDLPIEFSFNISPKQLLQPGFINEFIELRDKYQVDPSKLAIELTETLLILQFDLIIEKFKALDRKSTRLNSSHVKISYAVFCL